MGKDRNGLTMDEKDEAYTVASDALLIQQDEAHTPGENKAYEWLRQKLNKEQMKLK